MTMKGGLPTSLLMDLIWSRFPPDYYKMRVKGRAEDYIIAPEETWGVGTSLVRHKRGRVTRLRVLDKTATAFDVVNLDTGNKMVLPLSEIVKFRRVT